MDAQDPGSRGEALPVWIRTLGGLLPRAERGNREAQFECAEIWNVLCGAHDLALYWYRRAAAQGCHRSAHRLASLHSTGAARYRDDEEALYWSLIAVVAGSREAHAIYQPLVRRMPPGSVARVRARLGRSSPTRTRQEP